MYKHIRKYSLIFGAGGVAALQMMKLGIFSFPEQLRIYLGYFFSVVTVFCVFLTGVSVLDTVRHIFETFKKINSMDKKEPDKEDDIENPK